MTNVAEFMAKMAAELETGKVMPHDPVFINSKWGAVAVFGHELVAKKDLVILAACLNLPEFTPDGDSDVTDHRVRSIVLRDDGKPTKKGEPVFGSACPDVGGVAVNLQKIFEGAIEECMDNDRVSLISAFHRNFITTALHEIYHLADLPELPTDADLLVKAEDEAITWSGETLFWMAKTLDIEPASYVESVFLCKSLAALLDDDKSKWAADQQHMLDNHIFYQLPETADGPDLAFHTFKEYMRLCSEDHDDKEAWGQAVGKTNEALVVPFKAEVVSQSPAPPQSGMANLFFQDFATMDLATGEMEEPDFEGTWKDPMGTTFPAAPVQGVPMFQVGSVPAPSFMTNEPSQPSPQAFGGFPVAGGNAGGFQSAPMQIAAAPGYVEAKVYPETGLTQAQTAEIVKGVYMKCYNHIFTHCGRILNSDKGFANPEAVYQIGMPITPDEMKVIVKMDCYDQTGKWHPNVPTSGGMLFGSVSKDKSLPMYKLYINDGGLERVRLIVPQNPAKGTKTALEARAGACIMHIMEGDDAVARATNKKWLCKVYNGQLTVG